MEPNSKRTIVPPIITSKLPATRMCSITSYDSCMLDFSKKISNGYNTVNLLPEKIESLD